jgi:hypothetical protein
MNAIGSTASTKMDDRCAPSVVGDQARNGRRNNGIHPVLAIPLEGQLMAV